MRRFLVIAMTSLVLAQASGAVAVAAIPVRDLGEAAMALKVVFAARPQTFISPRDDAQMLYTVDFSEGLGLPHTRQITHPDGYTYDWPTWAFGGTKLVYTAMDVEAPEKGENLWVMDPDGTNRVQLTFGTWRHVQPKVSPDGTKVLFTARWHEWPLVGLFEYDLITGEVRNVSSPSSEDGARDSDPKWAPDGSLIVFSNTRGENATPEMPTQIYSMRPDGTHRIRLTHDSWWNTDPSISPDKRTLAISSYRGDGTPNPPDADGEFAVKFHDWHLSIYDIPSGQERVLTRGEDCTPRPIDNPCGPADGAAWVPQWSPDGSMIGYLGVRSWYDHGIYIVDASTGYARPLYERNELSITWWDWTSVRSTAGYRPFAAPARIDDHALLIGGRSDPSKPLELITSSVDRWIDAPLQIGGDALEPIMARWTADKKKIVFTARRPVDRSKRPDIEDVLGVQRNVHYTFNDYTFVELPPSDEDVAETQVYMINADGSGLKQITTPWTEDWLEAMPADDARGNSDPDVSPDGRYVVFTNASTKIPESYILRLDLKTGEVINLSAISSGAMAVADSKPRFSPDGKRIAFSSIVGQQRQLFVMDLDGANVTQITNDDYNNFDAAWSPDGRQIVYESYRGTLLFADDAAAPSKAIDLKNWFLAKVDLPSGTTYTLTRPEDSPVFRPVFSPDGARIAYISAGLRKIQIDVAMMNADGSDAHLVNTLRTKEEFVDWR